MSGILGIVFAILAMFTWALVFWPLAVLFSLASLRSKDGIATGITGLFLSAVAFAVSPSLWIVAGSLLAGAGFTGAALINSAGKRNPIRMPGW